MGERPREVIHGRRLEIGGAITDCPSASHTRCHLEIRYNPARTARFPERAQVDSKEALHSLMRIGRSAVIRGRLTAAGYMFAAVLACWVIGVLALLAMCTAG